MNLAQRTEALLALVQRYRDERCQALMVPAEAQARLLVRTALADGHKRVRTALAEQRKRVAAAVASADAALQTERRLHLQRHSVQWLGEAWPQLRAALLARWRDPATRLTWLRAHLQRAQAALPAHAPGWTLVHAPDWSAAEQLAATEAVRALGQPDPQFRADPRIGAGFRVQAGHNAFDATVDGLLAERALLEGRLLHTLEDSR